jgi:hypothetical protein
MAFAGYQDTNVYKIDVDSDLEYDSDGLNIIEPSSQSPSSYKGSVKAFK